VLVQEYGFISSMLGETTQARMVSPWIKCHYCKLDGQTKMDNWSNWDL